MNTQTSESVKKPNKKAAPTPEERFEAFLRASEEAHSGETASDQARTSEKGFHLHSFLRTEYARLSFYVIFTFIAIYLIKNVADNFTTLLAGATRALKVTGTVLTPLIWGFVDAYLLYPLMKFFQSLLQKTPYFKKRPGKSRAAAAAITILLEIGFVVVILSVIISALTHQLRMVSFSDLDTFVTSLAKSLSDVYAQLQQRVREADIASNALSNAARYLSSAVGRFTSNLGANLTSSLSNVTGILGNLLFAVIFTIYFLVDTEGLEKYWDKVLHAFSGGKFYRGVHLFLEDADSVFSGYIRGQMIDGVIMFAMVSVALSILNVQFAVIIGIVTGIGNLIPYVGPFLAYGSTIVVCLLNGDIKKMLLSIVVLFIIQTIDGNVINPKLLSSSVHVHPMLVIVSLTVGGASGGVLGMLIAVPVAALIKIWFDRMIHLLEMRRSKEKI